MAETKLYNKIVYGGVTLIDLTADTITEGDLANGVTAHDKSGALITGTSTKDSDTSDATVAVAEMLDGKTAYARGAKLTGTMPNNAAVSGTISLKDQEYTVPQGYHDGSGKVGISAVEKAKLIPSNIREDIVILGVTGTMSGSEGEIKQAKTATPSTAQQVILPDDGYTCLSQVTINAIPYVETLNAAGGYTATIA